MAAPTTPATAWEWPADVLAFAAEQQVEPCLEPLLEATRQSFPTARWLKVFVDADPEIPDDWHIVFEVNVPGWSPAQTGAAYDRWIEALFRFCPAAQVCIFRLTLDLGP
jgi:hypothetical protein